jgi:IS4 transposase
MSTSIPRTNWLRSYHERWEVEIEFDELKTHMLQRRECQRSKKPEGVDQEVWALLLTYNLLRRETERVSFWTSVRRMREFILFAARTSAPGNIPARLADFDANMARLQLPRRRSERRYPRHVKV